MNAEQFNQEVKQQTGKVTLCLSSYQGL